MATWFDSSVGDQAGDWRAAATRSGALRSTWRRLSVSARKLTTERCRLDGDDGEAHRGGTERGVVEAGDGPVVSADGHVDVNKPELKPSGPVLAFAMSATLPLVTFR